MPMKFAIAALTLTTVALCQTDPEPLTGELKPELHAPLVVDIDHASVHQLSQMSEAFLCLKFLLLHMENNPAPAWVSPAEFAELKESIRAICSSFIRGNHYLGTFPPAEWPADSNPAPLASTDTEYSDGRNTAEPNNNVIWDRGEFMDPNAAGFSPKRSPHVPTQYDLLRKFELGCTLFVELHRCIQVDPGSAGPAPGPGPAPPGPPGADNQKWSRAVNTVRAYLNSARLARYVYENRVSLGVTDGPAAAAQLADRTEITLQAWVRLNKVRKASPACTGFEDNPTGNW